MNIWILNHHALTPEQAGGTRHFDFAKELIKSGHSVTIFASSLHYATHQDFKQYKKRQYFKKERYEGVNFIWIKTYPYQHNGVKRVINMLDYTYKVIKVAKLSTNQKPDIIIGSSVHLFAVLAAKRLANYFKTPLIMEVRDIWPQTLIDLGISKWHPFILLLTYLEKYLYRTSDAIITNLPYAFEHIEKFVPKSKIHWIANGVDLNRNSQITPYHYDSHYFHVVYTGAIGIANQLDTLIQVAKLLKDRPIKFHIFGDGTERIRLEALAKEQNLHNIIFYGSIHKDDVIAKINGADLLFFPLADSPIFKYGIASNKLFDYLASKKPILFASNARNNLINDAKAGISVKAADTTAIKNAILTLVEMDNSHRAELGMNGYRYVSENYNIDKLSQKLGDLLESFSYNFKHS